MLAVLVHGNVKPDLHKGTLLVPLARWEDFKLPLRILRDETRIAGRTPEHYVTLVKVPESHSVAVIIGRPDVAKTGLIFSPLNALPAEDREIILDSMEQFRSPIGLNIGVSWMARLVLGERLPSSAIKWSKDFRLLQKGGKNAANKRT